MEICSVYPCDLRAVYIFLSNKSDVIFYLEGIVTLWNKCWYFCDIEMSHKTRQRLASFYPCHPLTDSYVYLHPGTAVIKVNMNICILQQFIIKYHHNS